MKRLSSCSLSAPMLCVSLSAALCWQSPRSAMKAESAAMDSRDCVVRRASWWRTLLALLLTDFKMAVRFYD